MIQKLDKPLLKTAAALGLLTGLVEGVLLLFLHQRQWLHWRLYNRAIGYETLWVAPLFDVILFSLAGLFLAVVGLVIKHPRIKQAVTFILIFLTVFDWMLVLLFGRVSFVPLLLLAGGASVQVARSAEKLQTKLAGWLPRLALIALGVFVAVQGGAWVTERIQTSRLPAAQTDAPNVIVIVVDTLRADHLSSYGYERPTSPFLDNLAENGVRFENAISASSWTQPAHASMLTGRYTTDHQAETKPLDSTYPTIGEALQAEGYRTGAFSANTLFFTRRQGFGRGFNHFEDNYQSIADVTSNSLYGFIFDHFLLRSALDYRGVPGRRLASDINAAAMSWADRDTDRPFFLFLNYFDVHDPYLPPEPYLNLYATSTPQGLINGFADDFSPSLTPEQIQNELDGYDGAINYVDDQIKDLFAMLEERGELENTIIIITSDHGEMFGEHGLLQHSASLYIEEIHVPLIVWGVDSAPTGKVIATPVSTSSLPATILSLINVDSSLFPTPSLDVLIFNDQPPADWYNPISEVAQFEGAAEANPSTHGEIKSVVTNEWHLIEHESYGSELYDNADDPQEQTNLAGESDLLSVVESLREYIFEQVRWNDREVK